MRTLFINGSPRGAKGNSGTFIETITAQIKGAYEIQNLIRAGNAKVIEEIAKSDTVVLVMPLYIHAMPGIVKGLMEEMPLEAVRRKKFWFIVQAGFEESATADYLVDYLKVYCERMEILYQGTIVKAGAAGLALMPHSFFKGLLSQLQQLGQEYDETGAFSAETIAKLGMPYELSEQQVKRLSSKFAVMANKISWAIFFIRNKAYQQRRAMPFKE